MASLNVGSMAARLGLDPADFLDKMKGVQGFNAFASSEMARQWKQTGRDGQEGIRLIDEALGIHVARPVARIVSETFPAFSKALSGILPGIAFTALGYAIFEFGEKAVEAVQRAMKAQEEWRAAILKTENVIQGVGDTYAKKIAEANGLDPLSKGAMKGAEEARSAFEKVSAAVEEQSKKAIEATGNFMKFKAAVGELWHETFTSAGGLATDKLTAQLGTLKIEIEQAFRLDALHGTHEAMKVFQDDLDQSKQKLAELQALQTAQQNRGFAFDVPSQRGPRPATVTPEQIAAVEKWIELLKFAESIERDRENLEKADAGAAARKAREEAQKKVLDFYKDLGSSLKKLGPETDPISKLHAEINSFRSEAVTAFVAVGNSAADALQIKGAHRALENYLTLLDRAKEKLESDVLAKQATELLSKGIPGIRTQTPTGFELNAPLALPRQTSVMPTLGSGGTAAAEFDTFSKDQAAQVKMAAQAYQDAMGPQQKYKLVEQELDLLLARKLINQSAYNAALAQAISLKSREGKQGLGGDVDVVNAGGGRMQELQQRSTTLQGQLVSGKALDGSALNADDIAAVKLAMQQITDEEDKILLKTGGVDAGIKAWVDSLQQVKSAGTFVFEELTQATKGFEDDAVKSIFDILDVQRGQHEKMIKELRKMWAGYFNGLAQEAMKHQLDKLLAPVSKQIGGAIGGTASAAPAAAAQTANTTALGTNTSALLALTARMMEAAASGAGDFGAAGNVGEAGYAGNAGDFAEGGDVTPGSSFISGEAGAEEVDLDRSGGAHITPLGSKGGDTYHQYDMRGAVVTDDLMRKADAAAMLKHAEPGFIGKAMANFSEVQRRTPQR